MKTRELAIVVAVGLGVLGYAVYVVVGQRAATERAGVEPQRVAKPQPKAGDDASPRPVRVAPRKSAPAAGGVEARPTPPEPEEGEKTLEDARAQFDDLIVELEGEAARIDKGGPPLSQAQWADYRTRGVAAIDGVLRKLDHRDPTHIEEINALQQRFREHLTPLEPEG